MYALAVITTVILGALPLEAVLLSEGCLFRIYALSRGLTLPFL